MGHLQSKKWSYKAAAKAACSVLGWHYTVQLQCKIVTQQNKKISTNRTIKQDMCMATAQYQLKEICAFEDDHLGTNM
jgi:hypothetical protein